ncbi:MAG: TVP38/TMEM64 family protein [Synechococcales cyanobacterium RM1_1_8]|nr:TVP38/TMEM64 family protein [Synechococcales cyanobacterium RM1_1_8]
MSPDPSNQHHSNPNHPKGWGLVLAMVCLGATLAVLRWAVDLDGAALGAWLERWGAWAPLLYGAVYVLATLLILPSTALNVLGGAVFGFKLGLLWTTMGALGAAAIAFVLARTVGRRWAAARLPERLQDLDGAIGQNALAYMFAIRLLPLFPYGLVNLAAGLTAMRFRDYGLGTLLGTVPGVAPFVWLGSSGRQAAQTGEVLPVVLALGAIALLVLGATRYRGQRPH